MWAVPFGACHCHLGVSDNRGYPFLGAPFKGIHSMRMSIKAAPLFWDIPVLKARTGVWAEGSSYPTGSAGSQHLSFLPQAAEKCRA